MPFRRPARYIIRRVLHAAPWLLACALSVAGCGRHTGEAPAAAPSPASVATSGVAPAANPAVDETAVREVVQRFGQRMRKVSTLASAAAARPPLRDVYADLLTPALLKAWLADPSLAVGRDVSSPWPEAIDIDTVTCPTATRCQVRGTVRYVTSNEVAHGGVAARRPIRLRVERMADGDWRIAEVGMETAGTGR